MTRMISLCLIKPLSLSVRFARFAGETPGRAIRTGYLMNYIGDEKLRGTIQAATNKSESFNCCTKWVLFGGEGIIAVAVPLEARIP